VKVDGSVGCDCAVAQPAIPAAVERRPGSDRSSSDCGRLNDRPHRLCSDAYFFSYISLF
jgi:hypothetical protein